MGLFSFLSKNKQDSSADVSGRYSRPEDEFSERARAKRASHAGGGGTRRSPDDPMLPEKKRARRRLVGAIALALAAAVGLPMLLDSEPKPLAGDVDIQIPAKDKAGPLPMPSAPASVPDTVPAPVAAVRASVAASQSVDKGEEIIAPPSARPAAPSPVESARKVVAVQATEKIEAPKPAPEHKTELARLDGPKPEHKDKPKPEQPKPVPPKKEEKPAVHTEDAARAMAILEGKAHEAGDKVVLQVAALGTPEKVAELQAKLRDAGIHSFTEKYQNLIRVKVGPYSRDEAEKVRTQLSKLGLSGKLLPV